MRTVDDIKQAIAKEDVPFITMQVIDDSGYAMFLFVGNHKGKEVIWNASMYTSKGDYLDKISNLASDDAYERYPIPDDFDIKNMFEKIEGSKHYRLLDHHPELTSNRRKFRVTRTMDILDSKTVTMNKWDIEVDESYEFGVGLRMRVDLDSINEHNVTETINSFKQAGMNMFDGIEPSTMCMTSEELGVELYKDKMIIWKDGFLHNDVAIKPGFFDTEDIE